MADEQWAWPKLRGRNPNPSTCDSSSQTFFHFRFWKAVRALEIYTVSRNTALALAQATLPYTQQASPIRWLISLRALGRLSNKVSTTGNWGLPAFLFNLSSRAAGAGAGIAASLVPPLDHISKPPGLDDSRLAKGRLNHNDRHNLTVPAVLLGKELDSGLETFSFQLPRGQYFADLAR